MRALAVNPVLPGFHPDPSICRVGEDFYVVTSTFEYFPGLPIHTSRDLAHWTPVGHVLDRPSQLPVDGVRASGGLYAPTIRWHDGVFYVVCTLVGGVREHGNFVVTATDPAGPWSEPTWLGEDDSFDPSLLFDGEDAWFCATRPRRDGGKDGQTEVWVQRFDPATLSLVGEQHVIWHGAMVDVVWAEAPHLYAVDGGYLLVVAEGGTAVHHSMTCARSANVLGPYENCRHNPVLTHRHLGPLELRDLGRSCRPRRGGGRLVVGRLPRDPASTWMTRARSMATSAVRRSSPRSHGRTAGRSSTPGTASCALSSRRSRWLPPTNASPAMTSEALALGVEWRYLRLPGDGVARLDVRPGHLALALAPETIGEAASPAFVCRPQDDWTFTARTVVDVDLASEHEAAGLALRQNDDFSLQLLVSRAGDGSRTARAITRRDGVDQVSGEVPVSDGPVQLTSKAAISTIASWRTVESLRCSTDASSVRTLPAASPA